MKLDTFGNLIWDKKYGSLNFDQDIGDIEVKGSEAFFVSSRQFNINENEETYWIKPWLFTIDSAGSIINSWLGEKNDSRTWGWGPIYHYADGDWMWASLEFKEVTVAGNTFFARAPTVTRLTSDFSLVWKIYLGHYTGFWDQLFDLEYDTLRDDFVIAGHRVTYYADSTFAELEPWIVRFTPDGEVLWSVSDTVVSFVGREMIHYTSGMDLSPSGSTYVAGYVEIDSPSRSYGWIVKVTPDGCMDTLCTTTSLFRPPTQPRAGIQLTPNPVQDHITLTLSANVGPGELILYDTYGRIVRRMRCKAGENHYALDFPGGLYYYTLNFRGIPWYSGKLVKL